MVYLHQFKLECRKHSAVFAIFTVLSGLANLYFLLDHGQDVAFVFLLVNMVIGILLPVYIYMDYYREFFTGTMPINHMLPLRTSALFGVKSAVFMLGLTAVWSTTLLDVFLNPEGLYQTRVIHSSSPLLGMTYFILSKLCSLPAGLALIGLALAAAKRFRKPALSHLCIAAFILITVGIQFALVVRGSTHWSIGSSSAASFKQYANLLTVSPVGREQPANINETINWLSVGMNLLVALLAGAIGSALLNGRKYELHGK
ncbi:hypothetical protein HQN87_22705 [Paenibacillus tritici]|uniref:ABC transporter permease n=1 Tax=Paenibacillus tritici TaxID=1873425 RepID=A0ABX2DUS9_9BACL|nr:hypothetical protein [Paenibacillus tritici]NQX48140.1 hypothetical protein [Paenibacillus tritici]